MSTGNFWKLSAGLAIFSATACAFQAAEDEDLDRQELSEAPALVGDPVEEDEAAMHYRMEAIILEAPEFRPTPDPWAPETVSGDTLRPTPDPWQPDEPMDPGDEDDQDSDGEGSNSGK